MKDSGLSQFGHALFSFRLPLPYVSLLAWTSYFIVARSTYERHPCRQTKAALLFLQSDQAETTLEPPRLPRYCSCAPFRWLEAKLAALVVVRVPPVFARIVFFLVAARFSSSLSWRPYLKSVIPET
jgi:hypothetical protein